MGYTHYFDQNTDATPAEWKAITEDFSKVLKRLDPVVDIVDQYDGNHPPQVTDGHISFNGRGEEGHEDMFVTRKKDGYQFCKTRRKPYDIAVMALLAIMDRHSDAWKIGSDGWDEPDMWNPAVKLVTEVVGEKISVTVHNSDGKSSTFSAEKPKIQPV